VEIPTIAPTIVARTNHFKTLIKMTDSSVNLLFILSTFTKMALLTDLGRLEEDFLRYSFHKI
jgi:hypothetical protein